MSEDKNQEHFRKLIIRKVLAVLTERERTAMSEEKNQEHFRERIIEKVMAVLTEREIEVVELQMDGKSITEIAKHLQRSTKTIEWHRRVIESKIRDILEEEVMIGGDTSDPTLLPVYIDPGNASEELISELYLALAMVYRSMGGSGLSIAKDQRRLFVGEALS